MKCCTGIPRIHWHYSLVLLVFSFINVASMKNINIYFLMLTQIIPQYNKTKNNVVS